MFTFPLLSTRGTSRATLVPLVIGGIGWWLIRRRKATRRSTGSPEAECERQPAAALSQANDLDLSLLRYLSDGTPSGLAEQIDRFVEALVKSEARVRAAAESGTPNALGDAAHALLSHGRMVNDAGLIAAAQQLEAATFEPRPDEIAHLQAVLLREANELRALLARWRPPTPPK